ncbi:MAG TPA: histone deacetylase family protein, partial [Pyrinomonadaceae bacterium]|nr:histone deacetylase family protein [Pyrinomonadaceae bacterium]
FRPDLVIVSSGFDAHLTDPLGQLRLEDPDFVSMTKSVLNWAQETCAGRVVSVLEGGYNLQTLGPTVAAHVTALLK